MTRANNQVIQVDKFNTGVIEEVIAINALIQKLRLKLKENLCSEKKRCGPLKHHFDEYIKCIPLLDIEGLKKLLSKDLAVWKEYLAGAEVRAQMVGENIYAL